MKKLVKISRQAIEYIDDYFSHTVSAAELRTWALAHPVYANPKELDNSEDWIVSNALALMIAVGDETADRLTVEKGLQEARRLLSGEESFPEDRWPIGLRGQGPS